MSTAVYAEHDEPRSSMWPWLIVAATLVLVAGFLLLGRRSYEAIERSAVEEFGRRQLLVAQEATHGIEFYFRALTSALRTMALDENVQGQDEDEMRHHLKLEAEELKHFGVWDVGLIDADGVLRYSGTDPAAEGSDFSSRQYYRQALEATSSDVVIVEFVDFEPRGADARGLLVGIPMFEPGEPGGGPGRFAGMLCCVLSLDFLAQEFVNPVKPSRRGHAVLIDEKGNVLWCADRSYAGTRAAAAAEKFPALGALQKRMLAGETGTGEFDFYHFDEKAGKYTDSVEKKLMAFAPLSVGSHTWTIGVWAPKQDALDLIRSAHSTQSLEMGFSILVVLVGCFLALGLFARISRVLERRVAEKTHELRESHERLLTVLDGLDAIVYVADIATHEILFVNRYAGELFGDVVGATCWQVLQAGQSGPCAFCSNDRLLGEGGEPKGVVVWEHQNTTNGRWYEIHDRAIRWHDGRLVRLEIAYDITERHRQREQIVAQNIELQHKQAQIEVSRRDLAAAAEQVGRLIDTAARDQSMDLSYENPNLAACWQLRRCTKTWCPCHGREAMRCWQIEGTFCDRESRGASFAEKVIRCRSCEVFLRSCPTRLTELAEGFNNMMFLLRRKGKEVSQLRYHALQQERMATIGKMAAGIAHEIDNPLASLFSLVQVLSPSAHDEQTKAQFAVMRQCIDRISKTVREIVDFGRPVGSEEWAYGDVEKIALDTLNLLRYDRRARNVEIDVAFEPALPKTLIIEHQLQQVFMNVMLNALDAMGGEGKLTVRGHRANGTIDVVIADTGEGIRSEDIQHIFEPFYSRKSNRKGTGLGLALSYNIVQRHGGTIRVDSEPGRGTTFVISIPLRQPDGPGGPQPQTTASGGDDATSDDPGR